MPLKRTGLHHRRPWADFDLTPFVKTCWFRKESKRVFEFGYTGREERCPMSEEEKVAALNCALQLLVTDALDVRKYERQILSIGLVKPATEDIW
jgi:hypothetical protein